MRYATADGSALVHSDYNVRSGQLTFQIGETSKAITVPVRGDRVIEPDETFVVNLSAPSNATLLDAQGRATILNDDAPPVLSITGAEVREGRANTANLQFTVSLSFAPVVPVQVNFATSNGTAAAPADFTSLSGVMQFAAGERQKKITVRVNGDRVVELDESFSMVLSNPQNATLGNAAATGIIRNDD